MSTRRLTAIIVSMWLIIVIVLIYLIMNITHTKAASMEECRPYASKTTQTIINYAWKRAYTACLNADEASEAPNDWVSALSVVTGDPPPGSVPATDPADEVKSTLSPPEAFCVKHNKHIRWTGLSWRCK